MGSSSSRHFATCRRTRHDTKVVEAMLDLPVRVAEDSDSLVDHDSRLSFLHAITTRLPIDTRSGVRVISFRSHVATNRHSST